MQRLLNIALIAGTLLLVPAFHVFAATRYVPEPFGGANLLGPEGADVKSWVPREVTPRRSYTPKKSISPKRNIIKKRAQIKKLNKAAKKPSTPKKESVYKRTKRYIKKKYTKARDYVQKTVKPTPAAAKSIVAKEINPLPSPVDLAPDETPIPELKSEALPEEAPSIEYDPVQDEVPLKFKEGGSVTKPRGLTLWERIKQFFGVKLNKPAFTPQPETEVVEEEESPPLPIAKPELPKEVEEAMNKCKRFIWNVPDNIVGVVLEVRDTQGRLTRQITISNYINIRPDETFELIPRCRG